MHCLLCRSTHTLYGSPAQIPRRCSQLFVVYLLFSEFIPKDTRRSSRNIVETEKPPEKNAKVVGIHVLGEATPNFEKLFPNLSH